MSSELVIVIDFGDKDTISVQNILNVLKLLDGRPNLSQRPPLAIDQAVERHLSTQPCVGRWKHATYDTTPRKMLQFTKGPDVLFQATIGAAVVGGERAVNLPCRKVGDHHALHAPGLKPFGCGIFNYVFAAASGR
jgi:hypothetical protein